MMIWKLANQIYLFALSGQELRNGMHHLNKQLFITTKKQKHFTVNVVRHVEDAHPNESQCGSLPKEMPQYIVKSTTSFDTILETETEYGAEYTSIDLVDKTKQAAAHDETSLCVWLSSHKLPTSYDESILLIPTEKLLGVVKPDNKYCTECR